MTRIFIEARHQNTTESVFVRTLLRFLWIGESLYEIIHVGGKDNLLNMRVKFQENTLDGGLNVVIFDADSPQTGGGYKVTLDRIRKTFQEDVKIDGIFLFPNNHDDGFFESLLVCLAQQETHKRFFDCFHDYELCLGDGYVSPDLKGKLFSYMSSQKALTKSQHRALGSGNWLFDDARFWNLNSEELLPMKDFLLSNIK